jgi:tripartite-type tricarboxylate transporter receptor subunit TctC
MIKILRTLNISVMNLFCAVLLLGSIVICRSGALAQTYPTKPIRIIVAGTPGASSDIIARLIGAKLAESFGQQVIVDNRAGAGGRIGTEVAVRAVPDGYTLLLMSSALVVNSAVYKDLKFDILKDFAPIGLLGTTPSILVVNPVVPAASVTELMALAKSKPGVLKFSSSGSGSSTQLAAEVFKFMSGTDIMHVPYKGTTPALTATMSGEVDMQFPPMTTCVSLIKSGKLRGLGVTSAKRTMLVPGLPAIAETVPGYEFMLWQGLVAPAHTPPAILARLNAEINKALKTADAQEKMAAIGNEPLSSTQEEFASYMSAQLEKMKEAVKLAGVREES